MAAQEDGAPRHRRPCVVFPPALRLATWLGLLAAGLALSGIASLRLFTAAWVPGWTSLLIVILSIGGVQLLMLGILGEYVGRIYGEVKRRPLYLVKERLGFPAHWPAGDVGRVCGLSSETVRWLKLSICLASTAGFVWLLAHAVDLDALGRAFGGLSVSTVLLALAFLAAGYAARIVRWWWMLRALEPTLPLGACAEPFLAGMAVNNVVPLRAGDALRVLGFRRQLRAPAMAVAGTLVVERNAVASRAGAGRKPFPDTAPIWRGPAPCALQAQDARIHRSVGRRLGLRGSGVRDRGGGDPGGGRAHGPWFSLAAGTLATTIPSAPGHVGTFDWFAAQGLEAYGTSAEVAIAFALTVHAVLWVSTTAAGLFCLLAGGIRPPRARGGVPPVPGRGGGGPGSAPPAFDKPPAAPRTFATTTIRAGAAGVARLTRRSAQSYSAPTCPATCAPCPPPVR